jgi:SAM-dependent methyltransferase
MSSIEFTWDPDEFDDLIASTEVDEAVRISVEHLPGPDARILEAGAGTGRVLIFLAKHGYHNTVGIELNGAVVNEFNRRFPELTMLQGDILAMPFDHDSFDVVLSYGVIEHFEELGPGPPLHAMFEILRPGGIAVVTVPSANLLRRLGDARHALERLRRPRANPVLRRAFGKSPLPRPARNPFGYAVFPRSGAFFEYRLTPAQFRKACTDAGFQIRDSRPISHVDGLYHSLGGRWIRFEHWQFTVPPWLSVVDRALRFVPFVHNHMHLCVLRKPTSAHDHQSMTNEA